MAIPNKGDMVGIRKEINRHVASVEIQIALRLNGLFWLAKTKRRTIAHPVTKNLGGQQKGRKDRTGEGGKEIGYVSLS